MLSISKVTTGSNKPPPPLVTVIFIQPLNRLNECAAVVPWMIGDDCNASATCSFAGVARKNMIPGSKLESLSITLETSVQYV